MRRVFFCFLPNKHFFQRLGRKIKTACSTLSFPGFAHMTRMLMGVGSGRVAMALEGG